jgi:crotonobetaine/carnitine-CoA ligase
MGGRLADQMVIGDIVDRQADRYGHKVCMHFEDDPVTYVQMRQRSNSYANYLAYLGLKPQECVALLMENSAEMCYVWFAAAKLGAIEVAINSAYKGEFLRHQLANSGASIVVADATLAPRVFEVAGELPDLRTVVVKPDKVGLAELDAPRHLSVIDIAEFLQAPSDALEVTRRPHWDDPCSILFTGGTTGPSKGAVLSHNYFAAFADHISRTWAQAEDDVIFSPLPLFHLNAKGLTVLGSIIAGGSGVLDRRFSVSRTWDRVRRYDASGISLLGSMLTMLWQLPPSDLDATLPIRHMICAPVPADLHIPIQQRYGCTILVPYGLTEVGVLTIGTAQDPAPPGTAGRPMSLYEVRVIDEAERQSPLGEVGEIVCRPREPHVMYEGYFADPQATLDTMKNLWFHTGDLGRFDEDGNLAFVDRKKDAMRRRGENVSSFEVEQAVMAHPAIQEVAAHAVPSEFAEDDIKICVVLKEGHRLSERELMDHCRDNMPFFAVPRYVEFMAELPRSPLARVLKYELRKRGVTAETWDRDAAGYTVTR